jgi:hypothetical protein
VLARGTAFHQLGVGDETVAKGDLFDHVGIVARPAEPLIDHIDEPDVLAAVEPSVYEVGAIDVEDDESCGAGGGMSVCHALIIAKGCYRVPELDRSDSEVLTQDRG